MFSRQPNPIFETGSSQSSRGEDYEIINLAANPEQNKPAPLVTGIQDYQTVISHLVTDMRSWVYIQKSVTQSYYQSHGERPNVPHGHLLHVVLLIMWNRVLHYES